MFRRKVDAEMYNNQLVWLENNFRNHALMHRHIMQVKNKFIS